MKYHCEVELECPPPAHVVLCGFWDRYRPRSDSVLNVFVFWGCFWSEGTMLSTYHTHNIQHTLHDLRYDLDAGEQE